MVDEDFTKKQKCPHCGNSAPMLISYVQSELKDHEDHTINFSWQEGYIYRLLKCPACEQIILDRWYWHDQDEPDDGSTEMLYPTQQSKPLGLPKDIDRAHEAAMRVRAVDANAYGVLMRRLLEMVCENRGAAGKDLNERLGDLAKRGEIPDNLLAVAHGLRQFGNVGAHATAGDLTPAAIPILDDLARAVLEYVYSAPQLVQRATDQLNKLKKKRTPKKSTKKKPSKKKTPKE